MFIRDLIAAMERIAPPHLAESWDNAGLLVGDPDDALFSPVLLAIDLSDGVLAEAASRKSGAIVAYHPPIFHGVKRLTPGTREGRTALRAAAAGVAVYSPHTALDAAPGGVTDWLIDAGIPAGSEVAERGVLAAHPEHDPEQAHKIVVFMPEEESAAVRSAMAEAGAGRIGLYRECSFNIPGRGTFHGGDGTSPTVGSAGRLEHVDEIRMEMVCSSAMLPSVIAALRAAHSYEEPAFDIYTLSHRPDAMRGGGRWARLADAAAASDVAAALKASIGTATARLAMPEGTEAVTMIGVCPGAGASMLDAAIGAGCDLFITGEMRHHEVLDALDRGCGVLLGGHTNTERGYLPILAERLSAEARGVEVVVSEADRWPFREV